VLSEVPTVRPRKLPQARHRASWVLNEGNREALAIEISPSLTSPRVVRLLEQLVAVHGPPTAVRCDNGPELIAEALTSWCEAQGIALQHIAPGRPNQNAFLERFNRTYRDEGLNAWVFTSLTEVRQVTEEWLAIYNSERPQDISAACRPVPTYRGRMRRENLLTPCVLDREAYACSRLIVWNPSSRRLRKRSLQRALLLNLERDMGI